MSYTDATVSPAARLKAATGVIAIHALVGIGVIAGLTITGVIAEEDGGLVAYFEKEPPAPPPPPQPIPEPADQAIAPVTAPQPPIPIDRNVPIPVEPVTPNISRELVLTPPVAPVEIPGPATTPSVSPAFDTVGPMPRNGPAGWISTDDYARSDLVREREGTAGYRLVIGSDGKVDACEITRSSGHATLDRNTCRLIESRARFDPAKNDRGETTVGTYTGSVTWRIPE
ncbi:TonB family protein [Aurantiacibacter poecillastricola]|uniref:TonB family protein n=1 Tax=Aurantiacibacter poecillastricola TaxID=3064385 RepID=UPI00273FC79B|nr:TonB family protein [Aurantiacibacter sp. 219JJ12-13]MDP5262552.1 TonB family protein [Aurantiacibacter sp. 219JJ12-13]